MERGLEDLGHHLLICVHITPLLIYVHVTPPRACRTPRCRAPAIRTMPSASSSLSCCLRPRASVRIKRILTNNGSCYRSRDFAAACARLGITHWRTRPYTPRTNGKAERFIKTLQERRAYARLYRSSPERAAALPGFIAAYSQRRSPTLGGHTPLCRFFGVNDLSGNHS